MGETHAGRLQNRPGEGGSEAMAEDCFGGEWIKKSDKGNLFLERKIKEKARLPINLSLFLCFAIQTLTTGGLTVFLNNKESAGYKE